MRVSLGGGTERGSRVLCGASLGRGRCQGARAEPSSARSRELGSARLACSGAGGISSIVRLNWSG